MNIPTIAGSWLAWVQLRPQIFRWTDFAPTDFEKIGLFYPRFSEFSFKIHIIVSFLELFRKSAPTVLKS